MINSRERTDLMSVKLVFRAAGSLLSSTTVRWVLKKLRRNMILTSPCCSTWTNAVSSKC